MNFTFLKSNGDVAFFRSDAEQADWCQEEMTVTATFPYVPAKVIERGMIMLFQDPATNDWQAYEIRQCTIMPGDYYQQLTAENLAISELTDCHVPNKDEIDNVQVSVVLQRVLSGTGWNVGNVVVNPVSSCDLMRGSVWQAVNTIATNWNVYIEPRVTIDSNGITGKYLDVVSSEGTDRGLRLAINKNVTDPCVTYDDSDMYTALYGYGGTYTEGSGDSRVTLEYNFSSVVWNKTADHPAKPKGQKYIEYPEMTALYGRNGKPRFGYYQNTGIDDPAVLLQKTWETLKSCCQPKISIRGTVSDLKRMGYADQPLRLHDLAIIELEPVGLLLYKQIIRLTVDLLDPTKNLPEIGDYIPNIIYINRETENFATGGGKGAGGGGGRTKVDLEMSEYRTEAYDNGHQIGMLAQHVDEQGNILTQAGMHIDPDTGVLIYAEDNVNMVGSKFHVQNNKIEAEVTNRKNADNTLSSKITQTANQISLEVSERKQGQLQLQSKITVQADRITQEITDRRSSEALLSSRITQTSNEITAEVTRATTAEGTLSGRITVNSDKVSIVVEDDGAGGYKPNSASIVAGINGQEGSYVKIKADTINLSGYVTASQLSATDAKIDNLTSGQSTAVSLKCQSFSITSGYAFTYGGSTISKRTVTIGGTDYKLLTWV